MNFLRRKTEQSIAITRIPTNSPETGLQKELKRLIEEYKIDQLNKFKEKVHGNMIELLNGIITKDAKLGEYEMIREELRCTVYDIYVNSFLDKVIIDEIIEDLTNYYKDAGYSTVLIKHNERVPVFTLNIKIGWKCSTSGIARTNKEIADELVKRPVLKDDLRGGEIRCVEPTGKVLDKLETYIKECVINYGTLPGAFSYVFDHTAYTSEENSCYRMTMDHLIQRLPKEFTMVKGILIRNPKNAIEKFVLQFVYEL